MLGRNPKIQIENFTYTHTYILVWEIFQFEPSKQWRSLNLTAPRARIMRAQNYKG